jgi:DNA polymerase (family 10)
MTDTEIAQRFVAIADILEIQGENPFKVRAYRSAAATILDLDDALADIHARGALREIPGFGDAIARKTTDFLTTGTTALWERIKDSVPEGVVAIAAVPGIGPKTAKALWEGLQIDAVAALEAALAAQTVRTLPGFGAAKETALGERLAAWRRLTERTPRYLALPVAERVAAALRRNTGLCVEIVGDLQAGKDSVLEAELAVFPAADPERVDIVQGLPVRIRDGRPEDLDRRIPPEIRDWPDLAERVRAGTLPTLIEESDFRGQLHEHTTYSDGRSTIAEMAEAALAKGYKYLAITDHSQSLRVANGLSRDRLLAQLEEIERLRPELAARGLTLLSGLEADILADGSLDGDDDLLVRLDIVVGSVHIRHKEDAAAMTRRIVTALENPHLDILGHPTGRLLGRREAYPLDIDAVIEAAVRFGKALEINASPERMDLSDEHARRAKVAGARFTINCDAHSAAGLDNLSWGLCMARRAGLEAADVINTWPLDRLKPRA